MLLDSFLPIFITIALPPLIPITVALIAGIGCQAYGTSLITGWLSLAMCAIASSLILNERQFTRWLWILACCCLSFLAGNLRTHRTMSTYFELQHHLSDRYVDITGCVSDLQNVNRGVFKQMLTLELAELSYQDQRLKIPHYQATIYVTHPLPVQRGDTLLYRNVFYRQAPSDLRTTLYAIKEGLLAQFYVRHTNYTILPIKQSLKASWSAYWKNYRSSVAVNLQRTLSPRAYALLASLFLGAPATYLPDTEMVRAHFTYWGITHYLARSGMHVAMTLLMWRILLGLIPLSSLYKQIILFLLLALFNLLSWPSISFTRALLSYMFAQGCLLANIPLHPLQTIPLVCFFVLLYNPFHLFFLGFQLSFGLTCALAWLNELELLKTRQGYRAEQPS